MIEIEVKKIKKLKLPENVEDCLNMKCPECYLGKSIKNKNNNNGYYDSMFCSLFEYYNILEG